MDGMCVVILAGIEMFLYIRISKSMESHFGSHGRYQYSTVLTLGTVIGSSSRVRFQHSVVSNLSTATLRRRSSQLLNTVPFSLLHSTHTHDDRMKIQDVSFTSPSSEPHNATIFRHQPTRSVTLHTVHHALINKQRCLLLLTIFPHISYPKPSCDLTARTPPQDIFWTNRRARPIDLQYLLIRSPGTEWPDPG